MEVGADAVWDEFVRRWRPLQNFIVSPKDGSPLRLQSDSLHDAAGNEFLVLDGVPALVPDIQHLVAEHFAVSAAAGPAPDAVLDPDFRPGTIEGYLLGRKLVLSDLEPVEAHQARRPGTVEIEDGALVISCASGAYRARTMTFSAWLTVGDIRDAESLVMYLYAKPPFFLNRDPFPSAEMITLYEALPFFRWYPLSGAQPRDAGFLDRPVRNPVLGGAAGTELHKFGAPTAERSRAYGPEFVHNVAFFRSIFQRYGIDVGEFPVLDIGGGDGFLGAAMEAAGAGKPISTDIRRPMLPGFMDEYPDCSKLLLGFADMFSWCYADDAYSFIAVRNNSAVCFATDLNRPALLQFLVNCRRSLRQDGLLYLSVITGENSQVDGAGMANRPVAEYLQWFDNAGMHVLQMTRLGTEVAFICCRPEAYPRFRARLTSGRMQDRETAFRQYLSGDDRPGVLHNFFMAVNDFAGEIALASHEKNATRIGLFGSGVLSYCLWRAFYVSHYELYQRLQLIDSVPLGPHWRPPIRSRLAHLLRQFIPGHRRWAGKVAAEETPGLLGERPLRVLVDDAVYGLSHEARNKTLRAARFDNLFIGHASDGEHAVRAEIPSDWSRPEMRSPAGDDWVFPLVSGDHDMILAPSIVEHYLSGRLRSLSPSTREEAAANAAFETGLAHFPLWYRGEQPTDLQQR